MKTKNLRPIDIDAHFKYRCPKCSCEHWISLNEAKTKGFRIVCDCKRVLLPRKISKLQISYSLGKTKKEKTTHQPVDSATENKQKSQEILISNDLLQKCLPVLINYGFTKQESEKLLQKAYEIDQSQDCGQLVKLALKSLEHKNE